MNKPDSYNSIQEIKKLSVAERILLVEDIWDSIISSGEDLLLSDEQKRELDSRLDAYYKNPKEGKSWEEVRKNIKSKL